jgi:hypothetical protein
MAERVANVLHKGLRVLEGLAAKVGDSVGGDWRLWRLRDDGGQAMRGGKIGQRSDISRWGFRLDELESCYIRELLTLVELPDFVAWQLLEEVYRS